MIVISDTTPLHYLIQIQAVSILEVMFSRVIIPQGVAEELSHPNTPKLIKDWMNNPPHWIEIRQADTSKFFPIKSIGKGETEAIALALELAADVVLIDDRGASLEARRAGLFFVGTVALLEETAKINLIDLQIVLDRLEKTSFYVAPDVIEQARERDRLRKKTP
jgi:predicted nucleic acid-binding protein